MKEGIESDKSYALLISINYFNSYFKKLAALCAANRPNTIRSVNEYAGNFSGRIQPWNGFHQYLALPGGDL
ncbi:hypothetical protein [Alkaliphilus crotonatoxidans]